MKINAGIIGIAFLLVMAAGCAKFDTGPSDEELGKEYLAKAQEYEARGDLVEALEQYKMTTSDKKPFKEK